MNATESLEGVAMEMGAGGWADTPTAAILEVWWLNYMMICKRTEKNISKRRNFQIVLYFLLLDR